MPAATAAALSAVPVDKAGVGSAVVNTSRQLGGSLGIALMGAIVAHEVAGRRSPEVFVHGLSVALVVASVIALAGAATAALLVRSHAERIDASSVRSTDRAGRSSARTMASRDAAGQPGIGD
jgi:DHA2 family methylenomycin A resistance protein-like MFS transporter